MTLEYKLGVVTDPAKTANPTCGPVPQDAVVAIMAANTTTDLPLDLWASTEGLEGVHHLVVWASREVGAEEGEDSNPEDSTNPRRN